MKWLWLVVLPGGSLIAVALVIRWAIRRRPVIAIAPIQRADGPRYAYVEGMEKADESLQVKSAHRREQAEEIRREANRLESGADSKARMRLVRR